MGITGKQREARIKHIGSSEAHKLLGLGYGSAYDLWLEKTGRIEMPDLSENLNIILGSGMEPVILAHAEERLGKLKRNQRRICKEHRFASNIDAIVVDNDEPVEAKTSGLRFGNMDGWGEAMTGEIPPLYAVQCHIHMICAKKDICHVEALLGDGRNFVPYLVERNEELVETLYEKCDEFWECVKSDTPPESTSPSIDVVKTVRRQPGKVIYSIPDKLLTTYENCQERVKFWTKAKEDTRDEILSHLFDAETNEFAEAGVFECGKAVTFMESKPSKRIDSKRLRTERPDIAEKYESGETSRRFSIKKSL